MELANLLFSATRRLYLQTARTEKSLSLAEAPRKIGERMVCADGGLRFCSAGGMAFAAGLMLRDRSPFSDRKLLKFAISRPAFGARPQLKTKHKRKTRSKKHESSLQNGSYREKSEPVKQFNGKLTPAASRSAQKLGCVGVPDEFAEALPFAQLGGRHVVLLLGFFRHVTGPDCSTMLEERAAQSSASSLAGG